ncbi:MAG: hypothetical protein HZB26_26540 [Candidatus Hydrogenedentes bacterium]|nr:hypothetical protein [Candidatus Hydrogenedentota bacterium]
MNTRIIAWAGILIVFVLALPLVVRPKTPDAGTQPGPGITTEEPAAKNVPAPDPIALAAQAVPPARPMMTQAQFFRVRTGMSYAQCVQVVGCEGIAVAPTPGANEAYAWFDADGRNQYTLSFLNGRLMGKGMNMTSGAKAQALKQLRNIDTQTKVIDSSEVSRLQQKAARSGRAVTVTPDEYQQIQTGMTYDQCVRIIGEENPMARGYTAQRNAILSGRARGNNTLDEAYKWVNPGGDYAEIRFHNGRVTAKTWKKGPTG